MPGYKALPDHFSGRVAEGVRYAEVLQRAGANDDAVQLLETALEMCTASTPEIPGWLCGRLAALYRTLKRYDDEVRLLERYRDSHQHAGGARTRFDARLSKARAIADRKRRSDTRSLDSVRKVISRRTTGSRLTLALSEEESGFSPVTRAQLREAFIDAAATSDDRCLGAALVRLRDEAHTLKHPPERMVAALKAVWQRAGPRDVERDAWHALYRVALTRSLALYFDEDDE
ncbi:MAG: hypothetical protein ABIP93_08710 [Gemmatimonadaceae bacterium]